MENGTSYKVDMKLYTVDQPIPNWVVAHRDEIYLDVLEQCEYKLKNLDGSNRVDVALLKTEAGITKFIIKDIVGIVESEKYELAARARDCIKSWKEIE